MDSSYARRASKSVDVDIAPIDSVYMRGGSKAGPNLQVSDLSSSGSTGAAREHGAIQYLSEPDEPSRATSGLPKQKRTARELFRAKRAHWFEYVKTKEFWLVLFLGQILSVCTASTNTLTELLADAGASVPAFQTLFNYMLLNLIYTSYTIYKYGWKKWLQLMYKDGWRFFILAFCDVQGNYFTVLAYDYTSILSCQLINFVAIAVVVAISVTFLGVRYHILQYTGILICCGGLGIMVASDHIHGDTNGGYYPTAVKGDMWALGGAAFYGLSNIFQEFLVSERPMYEVIGQLAFWAQLINGIEVAIFNRTQFRNAMWNGAAGGYLTGFTLILTIFYSLAPIMFRLSSAAFFNLSLLTANFWGVLVALQVFHLSVTWMYGTALVCIVIGHIVYFASESVLGEARKPWLGERQEKGVSGVGTAKLADEQGGFLGLGKSWGLWGHDTRGSAALQDV